MCLLLVAWYGVRFENEELGIAIEKEWERKKSGREQYKWKISTNGVAENVMLLVHHILRGTLTVILIMVHIDPWLLS